MRALTLAAALTLMGTLAARPAQGQEVDYRELWVAGESYETFRDGVTARRSLWQRNGEAADVPEALVERMGRVQGPWRLLVVALDRCSDSVSTLPFIAALVSRVEGLEMRVIEPEAGRPIMEAHPTPDGRPATPTVLLLDGEWRPAGAWVERPSELQAWFIANPANLSHDDQYFEKMAWYAEDGGISTMTEIVELVEAAAR